MSWGHDGRYFLSEYNFTFIHYSIFIEVKTLDIIIEDITCIDTREMQNFSSSGEKYFTSEHSEFMSDIFFTHVC